MKFITYNVCDTYDESKFVPVKNQEGGFVKPQPGTGFWASPVDAEHGWKEAATEMGIGGFDQDYEPGTVREPKTKFTFQLADHARVLVIETEADLMPLPLSHGGRGSLSCFDFEQIAQSYDVIHLTTKGQENTRWGAQRNLYSWDCECILVLNPGMIVPE